MANFSCPNSGVGAWHSCAEGSRFVGCCLQEPCAYGCLLGNLAPAFFNTDITDPLPELECDQGTQFYACANSGFWGCCKTDACAQSGGCPEDGLRPATLVSDARATAAYSPTGDPSSLSTASLRAEPSRSHGVIIGASVGGPVGALLIGILVFFFISRKRRKDRERPTTLETAERGESFDAGISGPAELSANVPPRRYLDSKPEGPVFELPDNQTNPRTLSELMSKDLHWPAELDATSTAESTPRNSRRFSGGSAEANQTRQSIDEMVSEEGGDSNQHPCGAVSAGVSPPQVPASPPAAYPPTIPEEEDGDGDDRDR